MPGWSLEVVRTHQVYHTASHADLYDDVAQRLSGPRGTPMSQCTAIHHTCATTGPGHPSAIAVRVVGGKKKVKTIISSLRTAGPGAQLWLVCLVFMHHDSATLGTSVAPSGSYLDNGTSQT